MTSYAVTGAARGIGFALTKLLSSRKDAIVYAIVRNTATAGDLRALGRANVHIIQGDVTDRAQIASSVEEISKIGGGKLDVLIANAGYVSTLPISRVAITEVESEFEAYEKEVFESVKINATSQVALINAYLPLLRNGTEKKIIAISSGAADLPLIVESEWTDISPYAISKAALNVAIAKFAAVLKPDNFTVLAVSPGVVQTYDGPGADQIYDGLTKLVRKAVPSYKGAITAEESAAHIAKLVVFAGPDLTGGFLSHFGSATRWV